MGTGLTFSTFHGKAKLVVNLVLSEGNGINGKRSKRGGIILRGKGAL